MIFEPRKKKIRGGVRNKYVIEIKRQNDLNLANQSNTILKKSIVINGIINPEYNPKINPETGIISQILWVNQPSPVPFASDPLNEVGLFSGDQPQTGFLAEGMVVAKGIIEKWNGNQTVSRKPFNEKLIPANNGEKLLTKPEDENQHQSTKENWYYLGKKDDLYSQKFVKITGEKGKTTDFLSTVDPKYAVNFWSTFHGFHLRSFLKNYYSFTDQEIQRMSYENVLFFWNEYVFLTKQQRIAIPKQSFNLIDFHHYQLTTIKVNQKEERQLKPTVLTQIQQQLSSQGLILNVDYEINPYDHQLWQRLTNFTNGNKRLEQTLHLYAKIPNSKIYGQKQIKIINDANFSQEKLIDLSKITFPLLKLNINDADQLAKTIKAYVTTMTKKYQLQADQDYQILLLNNKTWKDLVVGKNNEDINFQVQIQATDQSQKTIGFNTFLVENSTSFPEVINPEIDNDKIKTINITKEKRRKIGGEILNNVDAINTSINQIPITFNNQFFPKIEDVNNGLENVAKELATNIKTLNQTLSQYIGNYKANPALLKTIKDSDNNDENLKKLVAKINELYKTYQVIKKSIPSLFGPKNLVDSLPSLQKIAKYDPTIPKNTPPPLIAVKPQ